MTDEHPIRKLNLDVAATYILDQTKHVIETFSARDPGSDGEARAQEYIRQELETCADEVRMESFPVAPKAFMAFMPIASVLLLTSIQAYGPFPKTAFALACIAFGVVLFEFVLYRQLLDPLFPKRTSYNVYAVRKASEKPKRRIILNGHVDAAYEWRYNLIGRWALTFVAFGSILGVIFLPCLNLAHLLIDPAMSVRLGPAWRGVELLRFAFLPVCTLAPFYTCFSVVAPGANDNLTGTFAAMAILRQLHDQGIRFAHTEVACLITGSEEAGLRGAKAFARSHRQELTEMETAILVLETLRDLKHLAIYNRDMSGTVKNHPGVSRLIQQAGKNCGLDLKFQNVYIGSTDAAAFTQAGIPASTLAAMDPEPPRYYHTRLDHWSNMDPECLRRALDVAVETVALYDRQGLDPSE